MWFHTKLVLPALPLLRVSGVAAVTVVVGPPFTLNAIDIDAAGMLTVALPMFFTFRVKEFCVCVRMTSPTAVVSASVAGPFGCDNVEQLLLGK